MTTKEKWRNSTKKLITLSQIAPIDHIRDGIHKTSQITASTAGMLTAGFLKTETAATRRRNVWGVEWMLGSNLGQFVFLLVTAFSMVCGASIAWDYYGNNEEADDSIVDEDRRWRAALWFSWSLFFDPGTQTGLSGYAATKVLICAGLISSLGFIFNLVMLGFMVDQIREMLLEAKAIYGREVVNDHILILGWTDKTLFLLEALMVELSDEGRGWFSRRPTIVVLGATSRVSMIQSTRLGIPKKIRKNSNVRLIFRQGLEHEVEDLVKVSATSARVVLVLGASRDPEVADLKVTSAVLAVKSISKAAPVLAEVRLFQSVGVVKSLGGKSVMGVAPTPLMDNLMVISALAPAVGLVMAELISFQNTSGFLIRPQPSPIQRRIAAAHYSHPSPQITDRLLTFGQTRQLMQSCVVVGIVPADGNILFAPPDSRLLAASDHLLVIAKSRTVKHDKHDSTLMIEDDEEDGVELDDDSNPSSPMRAASPNMEFGTPESAKARRRSTTWRAAVRKRDERQVVIILGWRTGVGMTMILKGFDDRLDKGAEVHILSFHDEMHRKTSLANGDFTPQRIKIVHHVGEITRMSSLQALPLASACSVLVLRDEAFWDHINEGSDAHTSDARALSAAVLVCQLFDDLLPTVARPPIVVQFLDNLAQRILKKQSHLIKTLHTLVPIHRNALETGILALAVSEPKLVGFFEGLLISSDTNESRAPELISAFSPLQLLLREHKLEASQSDQDSVHASFWELDSLVRQKGMLLLGWHRGGESHHTLNPLNKSRKLPWGKNDLILVGHSQNQSPQSLLGAQLDKVQISEEVETITPLKPLPENALPPMMKKKSRTFLSFSE